jgi:DNA uptake protein ComE-like DNA-binding protein
VYRTPFKLPEIWSASQRRGLLVLLAIFAGALAIEWARNRLWLPNPLPAHGPAAAELADRIDPNSADWQTLSALPGIGEKRAQQIVAYRQRRVADRPGRAVFGTIEDLGLVSGIGPETRAKLAPYLMFPTTRPGR